MWLLKLMANLLQSMATIGVLPPPWEWNGFILYALDISSRLIYCKTNRAASEPRRELNPWNWNSCCHCSSCYHWHPGIRSLPPSKIMRSPCIHFAAPFTFPVPRASFPPPSHGGSSLCHRLNLDSSSVLGELYTDMASGQTMVTPAH